MIMKRRRGSSNFFLILQGIRPLQLCSIKSLYRDVTSKYYHDPIFAKKFNQTGRKILQKGHKAVTRYKNTIFRKTVNVLFQRAIISCINLII